MDPAEGHSRLGGLLTVTAVALVLASVFADVARADLGLSGDSGAPLAPLSTATGVSSTLTEAQGALEQSANDTLSATGQAVEETVETTTSTVDEATNDTLSSAGQTLEQITGSTTSTLEQTVDEVLGGAPARAVPIAPTAPSSQSSTAPPAERVAPPVGSQPPVASGIPTSNGRAAAPPLIIEAQSQPVRIVDPGSPATRQASPGPRRSARLEHKRSTLFGLDVRRDPAADVTVLPAPRAPEQPWPGDATTPLHLLLQTLTGGGLLVSAVLLGLLGLSSQASLRRRPRTTVDVLRPPDVVFRLERPG
jgi:hypothetical protein